MKRWLRSPILVLVVMQAFIRPHIVGAAIDVIPSGGDSDGNADGAYWGYGGNAAALLALRGHRFNQRDGKILKEAHNVNRVKENKTHRGYVAAIRNRASSRPTEVIKFSGPRINS